MRWDVPSSWEWAEAGDIAAIVGGSTPTATDPANFTDDGIPWLTPADLTGFKEAYVTKGARSLSQRGYDGSGAQLLPAGSVLFTSRAPIGYCVIAANPVSTNQGFKSLVLKGEIVPEFVRYYLVASKEYAESLGSGTTFLELSGARMKTLEVPVAPLPEQRRIVAKLDELRARSRKAREALDEVPALLDRLKQSVLAAAFRGDLTAEWRAAHPDVEPASVLLERIRVERRRRWEEANPKKKYVEPESVDTEGLPELPEGWCWASLGDAFEVFVGATPSRKEPAYWGGDIAWVSSGEVGFCRIKATRETITEAGLRNTSTDVHPPGTVLIGMIGEGRTRGQVAILDIPACNNQNSAAIRVEGTGVPSEFVYRYLESQYERSRSLGAGNNQPALSKSRVQAMLMPLAPLPEQVEMVAILEAGFGAWTDTRASRDDASAMLASLDQSLLAHAFRGELVPQDPDDEPAAVLLARIKAEAGEPGTKKRRDNKEPRSKDKPEATVLTRKDTTPTHLTAILKEHGPLAPEALWKASQMDIDEFYDQLKDEEARGLLRETRRGASAGIRMLELIK